MNKWICKWEQKRWTTASWVQYISIYSMQLFALILFSQIPNALYTGLYRKLTGLVDRNAIRQERELEMRVTKKKHVWNIGRGNMMSTVGNNSTKIQKSGIWVKIKTEMDLCRSAEISITHACSRKVLFTLLQQLLVVLVIPYSLCRETHF